MASFVIFTCGTVIGNVLVFRANRDKSDFIARAICLTVPIGFKILLGLLLILIPLFILFYNKGWISESGFSNQEQIAFISLGLLFEITYYSLLLKAVKQVNEILEAHG